MTGPRVRPRRSEIVTTVVVVLLTAAAAFALWPRGAGGPDPAAGSVRAAPTSAPTAAAEPSESELAPLRASAGLDPCPAGSGEPAAGPLAGITVPCLGTAGQVDLGRALAGRPALLNVWATWCVPCRDELPALAEYAARPDAVPVLGIDVRDDPRAALALLAEIDVTVPSVWDPDGRVAAALDIPPVLPLSYVVRADGTRRPGRPAGPVPHRRRGRRRRGAAVLTVERPW